MVFVLQQCFVALVAGLGTVVASWPLGGAELEGRFAAAIVRQSVADRVARRRMDLLQ